MSTCFNQKAFQQITTIPGSFYRSDCRVHYQTAEQSENKQSPGADE